MQRLLLVGFVAGSLLGILSSASAENHGARPNVLVILTDDQGYGDMSCHGNPRLRTPNMDRLYAESIRFTDFHVAPICTPSRGQLLSGRDALANGAMNASSGRAILRRGLPTMGSIFAANGYRTAMFGKWHLGHTFPYRPGDRGFEKALWFPMSQISSAPDAWLNDYVNDQYRDGDRLQRYSGYCTDVFFREAMNWMRETRDEEAPFFLYLPLNAAHYPYFVEEKYSRPYQDLPGDLPNFFGMIANIDENMGRLEAMLRETGLRDNTILIFMSDNGTAVASEFYNAGMRGHKFQSWEGGHRVPCFVRWPNGNLREAGDITELTQCQDVLPTLIDLCGLRTPEEPQFDGISLASLLRGQTNTLPERMLVVQHSPSNVNPDRGNISRPQYGNGAVLWNRWRLVKNTKLYDLRSDPGQERNIAAEHPGVVSKMLSHYDAWWNRVDPLLDSFEPTHIGADEENPVVLTPGEWGDVWLDQSAQVRQGMRANGVWHLQVARAGGYELSLRRWPPDCDAPMGGGLPAHEGEVGGFDAGVALPIAAARIRIEGQSASKTVNTLDRAADFSVTLREGPAQLQTWFDDSEGREICGAYYVVVTRTGGENLIADPGFEEADKRWRLEDSGSGIAVSQAHGGSNALKLVNDFNGHGKGLHNVVQRRIPGVEGGKEYEYSVWVRGENVEGIGNGGKPITELRWLDRDGKKIGRGLYMWAPYGTYPYTRLTIHAEAPQTAAACEIHFRSWWECTGGATYWDDADLRPRSAAAIDGRLLAAYEAEDAGMGPECAIRDEGIGYTGAGYVHCGQAGAYVEWRIHTAPGPHVLSFRYAAEAGARPCALTINGIAESGIQLLPTGMPTSWATDNRVVTLISGDNVIRLQSKKARTGLHIDHLKVYEKGP